jgi:NADH dehydrogenase FAD-containing subunit
MTTKGQSLCDIVILGAGYAGLMAALRLSGVSRRKQRIMLVNAIDQFVERVRLQEAIARPIAARIPSISTLLAGSGIEFIEGQVQAFEASERRLLVATIDGSRREIGFERSVYALGSAIDVDTILGAAEHAYRLNPGDGRLAVGALRDKFHHNAGRRLRVVVVGGGATGIEVASEIKTYWPQFAVTILSQGRCGSFKDASVERAMRSTLLRLGVELRDQEGAAEVLATAVLTSTGKRTECDICICAAGLRSSDLARRAGLATDAKGRIFTDPLLRSVSHPHVFAAGDAARPIAPTGAPYRQSVFAALTSGAFVADVITNPLAENHRPYSFSTYGQGISIGSRGVGFLSYLVHRFHETDHMRRIHAVHHGL